MPHSRLLRYIFRHGPHSPRKNPPLVEASKPSLPDSPTPPVEKVKPAQDAAPATPSPRTADHHVTSVLENIIEESPEESLESLASSIASLNINISSFTTHELLHAAIEEARTATYAHLNTIDTTLLVLDALDGFSKTITALMKEMVEKKRICEGKLAMLDEVEDAVGQTEVLVMDDSDEDATLRGRQTYT